MAFKCDVPALQTVLRDDETVRISRWDFEPGAVTGWHRHEWPYFAVMLTDGRMLVHDGKNVIEAILRAGQTYMVPPGATHDVMNGSDHPMAFVEIEVKRPDHLQSPPGSDS